MKIFKLLIVISMIVFLSIGTGIAEDFGTPGDVSGDWLSTQDVDIIKYHGTPYHIVSYPIYLGNPGYSWIYRYDYNHYDPWWVSNYYPTTYVTYSGSYYPWTTYYYSGIYNTQYWGGFRSYFGILLM